MLRSCVANVKQIIEIEFEFFYRISELQDSLDRAQDQLRQTESDLDQVQGERADKLRDLKTKEKQRKGNSYSIKFSI